MSTAITIAVIAASQSSLAASQANQARIVACNALMPSYNAQTATVAEARTYADCVFLLHPDPASGAVVLALKAAIVCAIVGAISLGWLNRHDVVGLLFMGFIGAVLGGAIPFLLVGLYYALAFLIS